MAGATEMSKLKRVECKGCLCELAKHDISDDGYCKGCQYEHEAKQDAKTDD